MKGVAFVIPPDHEKVPVPFAVKVTLLPSQTVFEGVVVTLTVGEGIVANVIVGNTAIFFLV